MEKLTTEALDDRATENAVRALIMFVPTRLKEAIEAESEVGAARFLIARGMLIRGVGEGKQIIPSEVVGVGITRE
jgi:hypothetical protein